MKRYFLFIAFLCFFTSIIRAQESYGRVRIEVMPDGSRKAVLVKDGKEGNKQRNKTKSSHSNQRVRTGNGPLLNIKVETEKEENREEEKADSPVPVPEPVRIEPGHSAEREKRETLSFPEPVSLQNDYVYFQPYTYDLIEEEYEMDHPVQENFSVAVHYELIPSSGFSDLAHNAGLQLTVDNFVLDGFVGRGSVEYSVGSSDDISESFTSYGANLGYKMRVAPRFHIYPLIGIIKSETISDKLTYNYGIGLHYFFNKRFFFSYKFTRYSNGLGIGISLE